MASIERTAYPHFSRVFTAREIQDAYTPTPEEILLARLHVRSNASLLAFLVLLKCFQRLQYFPPLPDVPAPVVDHVRSCLHLPPDLPLGCDQPKTLYRYHAIIREHLEVKAYKGKEARHTAVSAAYQAAEVMDQQTDKLIVERTCAGLEAARRLGRNGGRKRQMTDSKMESAKKLLANGVLPRDVAKNLGVSIPTLYRWIPAPSQQA